jgi:hypothetical protein
MQNNFHIRSITIVPFIILFMLKFEFCFSGEDKKKSDSSLAFMHHGDVITPDPTIPISIGIFGSGLYTRYQGSFGNIDNNLSGLNFENGSGVNYSAGTFVEFYLFSDFSLLLRGILENESGKMKTDYYLPIINDQFATTEHELRIKIFYISLDLLLKYDLSENIYILGGGSYGIPFIHKYSHNVKIISDEISYSDGTTEKTFDEKEIPSFNNKISFKAGLGFNIPIVHDRLYLSPEFIFEGLLSKITSNSNWKSNNLFGSLIFKYEL